MCDVSELMEETINRVRQGSLDLRSANTIGFLASVHMKAINEARNEDRTKEDGGLMYQTLFERMREGRVLSPQESAYLSQEPSPQPIPSRDAVGYSDEYRDMCSTDRYAGYRRTVLSFVNFGN